MKSEIKKTEIITVPPQISKTYRKKYIEANIFQALALNKILPSGVRLVAENEIGKTQFPDLPVTRKPSYSVPSVDVTIKGERATSRQIAIKEREARKKQEA